MVSIVEVNNPPITTVANGRCTSAPAPVERAIGRNPIAAAPAVSITGRNLFLAPLMINSRKVRVSSWCNSFRCSINTIPFNTAIPKRAIKPTPAETLNGMPLIQSNNTPPTVAKGIAENIIMASFNDLKAKCKNIKMSNKATGTAISNLLVAFCKFSN
ncbi:hypothetical protein SDC9_164929 [bioreactor metagenome]|uniref:Uncharacterized protein n=1 Tax=bioreactor metagenome TaxID=1076179 RepID=A0A645G0D8_9ZZZZ